MQENVDGLTRVKKIVLDLKTFSYMGEEAAEEADINKVMEKCKNILVNIPNTDYDIITTDIIDQIYAKRICYVTLNKTYKALKDLFYNQKISTVNIAFVDGITRTIIKAKNRKDCSFVSSSGALDELTVTIFKLLSQGFNYLIFDSLSDLLTYRNINEVEQFVKNITDPLVENKCKGIFYAISRYKYAPKNRPAEIMYSQNNKEHELLYARLSKIPHYYLVLPENIYNQTETKRTVNDLLLNLLP